MFILANCSSIARKCLSCIGGSVNSPRAETAGWTFEILSSLTDSVSRSMCGTYCDFNLVSTSFNRASSTMGPTVRSASSSLLTRFSSCSMYKLKLRSTRNSSQKKEIRTQPWDLVSKCYSWAMLSSSNWPNKHGLTFEGILWVQFVLNAMQLLQILFGIVELSPETGWTRRRRSFRALTFGC